MKKPFPFLIGLILFISTLSYGQAVNRKMLWVTFNQQYNLKNNFVLQIDAAVRSTDAAEQLQTIFIKPQLGYRFHNGLTFTAGYNLQFSRINQGTVSAMKIEDQLIQSQLWKYHKKRFQLLQRLMLEERFVPRTVLSGSKILVTGHPFTLRTRLMFRAFWHWGEENTAAGKYYTYGQQESFINLIHREVVNNHAYDQARFAVGIGHHFDHIDTEMGLMLRDLQNRDGSHFHDHILQMTGILKF